MSCWWRCKFLIVSQIFFLRLEQPPRWEKGLLLGCVVKTAGVLVSLCMASPELPVINSVRFEERTVWRACDDDQIVQLASGRDELPAPEGTPGNRK